MTAPSGANPPLKRHPALRPLSREHMNGLIQARNLTTAALEDEAMRYAAIRGFVDAWNSEIREHFEDEERLLGPLTQPDSMRRRLLDEHAVLRSCAARCTESPSAAASDPAFVARLGSLLHDHIRWEEREYFQFLQHAHPFALDGMRSDAEAIERKRFGARARRTCSSPRKETDA